MFPDHIGLHAAERGDDRVDLMSDIDAVTSALDHLLNAPNLPLDAPEPWNLMRVIDRDAPVCRLGSCHLTVHLWRNKLAVAL